jgi:predicted methyltransferase
MTTAVRAIALVAVATWLGCAHHAGEPAAPGSAAAGSAAAGSAAAGSAAAGSAAAGSAAAEPAAGGPAAAAGTPVEHVAHPTVSAGIAAIVFAPERLPGDRALDAGRHPGELLAFMGVAPGMRVGELEAGQGYTTELVARAVGSQGRVYAENNRFVLERFAAKPWAERLQRPALANVVRVDRELEDPFPPEAHDLDGVYINLFYHDTIWLKTDREAMNRAVFRALRPGGFYLVADHAARPGSGTADAETLHRIDEALVISEVERAGFRLAAEGDFLRNPADNHDWNASPRVAAERRGTSDRFALRFVKP